MRKKIVAGNWKMNKTLAQALALASEIQSKLEGKIPQSTVILCPPALYLAKLQDLLPADSGISLGAQNSAAYSMGAYTGEIAAEMLATMEIPYVILGHSERRTLFGDTIEILKNKVDMALSLGLYPIFCCGEPLEVREQGNHEKLVKEQIEGSLFHLGPELWRSIVIAYEPVWAIGTGKTATAEQAQEMHAFIRQLIVSKYGETLAQSVRILYGGSVKASNAAEIFSKPDVDGGLIGGAALQADEFVQIVQCA